LEEIIDSYNTEGFLDVDDVLSSLQYVLTGGLSKYYSGLDVWFDVPNDFEVTALNFQFEPNPIFEVAEPVPMTGMCLSDPAYINYFLSYPLVASVTDSTGAVFNFAHTVYIQNNSIGDWGAMSGGFNPTVQQDICSNTRCTADITVQNSAEQGIEGASVGFMGCPLGKTDENGLVESTSAPCGVGELTIYSHGYSNYEAIHTTDYIYDATITLTGMPFKRVHVYEVHIIEDTEQEKYLIADNAIGLINTDFSNLYDNNVFASMQFILLDDTDERYDVVLPASTGEFSYIPAGVYSVSSSLTEIDDDVFASRGATIVEYTLSENGDDIYVYLPFIMSFADVTGVENQGWEAIKLTALMRMCELDPVSNTPLHESFEGCEKTYDEVWTGG
ncbi:MAG: hypothetical protein ACXABY_04450, partial [Candidatus Thorarchaeota archaeon]